MTVFGITPSGFNRKLLANILQDTQDRHRASFGAGIDVAIATELGQLDGNYASGLAEAWELLGQSYNAFNPEDAAGFTLDVLASLTGTTRDAAQPTKFTALSGLTVTLNAGTTLPAGSLFALPGRPDLQFSIDAAVTNSGGSPASLPATATCTQTGPIAASSGTYVIATAVSGWTAVQASSAAVTGRDVANDIELRQKRANELALRGGSTVDAIKADLLDTNAHPELAGIRSVSVLENTTDVPDANGVPGHSFEVLIDDGDTPSVANNAIAQAIWDSRPAGIPSSGSSSGTAIDKTGTAQTVKFSRVTLRPIYISATLTRGPSYVGDAAVKAALVQAGSTLLMGQPVVALALQAVPLAQGATDVPTYAQGFAPSPTLDVNLTVGVRERATFDASRIVLT